MRSAENSKLSPNQETKPQLGNINVDIVQMRLATRAIECIAGSYVSGLKI